MSQDVVPTEVVEESSPDDVQAALGAMATMIAQAVQGTDPELLSALSRLGERLVAIEARLAAIEATSGRLEALEPELRALLARWANVKVPRVLGGNHE